MVVTQQEASIMEVFTASYFQVDAKINIIIILL